MAPQVEVIRLPGLTPYDEALTMQRARRNAVEQHGARSALFILEHPPTITLGRKAHAEHLLKSRAAYAEMGVAVCETDRGGDVTYHGPGQLVAYPVLRLSEWRLSIDWYLRALEDVLIALLKRYGLEGAREEALTGVWVGGAKVAAIGIGIRQWVTYHGLALNVAPNMSHFGLIVPCGIQDKPVTSLAELLKETPDFEAVADGLVASFANCFDCVTRVGETGCD